MGLQIYLDGKLVPEDQAKVSVFDHGLLYGDGVFEGIRGYNGKLFKLDEHIGRLFRSAKAIRLEIPLSFDRLKDAVIRTVRANDLRDSYVRVVVTRGVGDLGLDPVKCKNSTVFIIASRIQLYPESVYQKGLDLVTVGTRRSLTECVNPAIKSLNYLNNILAKIEAANAGASEALILNHEGYVSECSGENLFILRNRMLKTPAISCGALDGVTRNIILDLGGKMGLAIAEDRLTRYDIYTSDECFLTGTAAEIVAVTRVDGRTIGTGNPGPVTLEIRRQFREMTRTEGTPVFE